MSIFDYFMCRKRKDTVPLSPANQPIPEEERQYYRPEDYYRDFKPNGDPVITFDERRKTAYPSRGGLYPAEILLLSYCTYGTYPHPKNGYPGFWWYEYGIRNVGAVLKSLEERGFLETVSAVETLPKLTAAQLKDLLEQAGRPAKGKKAELLQAVKEQYDEETLARLIPERKYRLTARGLDELNENEYVPYMHHHPHKTIEIDLNSAGAFHVWAINRLLAGQDHSKWREICDRREAELDAYYHRNRKNLYQSLEQHSPELARKLKAQDAQLEHIKQAENAFRQSGDVEELISFWEELWRNGGLLFNGAHWTFRLADLYIEEGMYQNALTFVTSIKGSIYSEKKEDYLLRIERMMNKKPGR